MNVNHHQSDELLLDYASGALGEAWSLAVATHLALCPQCRASLAELEAMGGALLESLAPTAVAESAFDAVMARLDEAPESQIDLRAAAASPASGAAGAPVLPEPLRSYVGGDVDSLDWQRLGLGAYQLPIATAEGAGEGNARLLRIPAGRPVPEHGHGGLELTLVLCGAFSDATGEYRRGDLQVADESLEHQPVAAKGEDCICLAVTDAPLRFSSLAARLVQPLIGI